MINADMPETLEEALKLIESNRSRATEALMSAISSESLDNKVIAAQLYNGADVSVENSVSHENLAQILKRRTCERLFNMDALCDLEGHNNIVDAIMSEMKSVFDTYASAQRVLSYYADLPQMFFTLARRRADVAIDAMLTCYGVDAINVTDSDGETALDFALENDPAAASVLRKHGATVRGIYRAGSRKMREMLFRWTIPIFFDEASQYLLDAVKSGFLDVNGMMHFGGEEKLQSSATIAEQDDYGNDYSTCVTCTRQETNVFLESILLDSTGELVKKCIEHGANVNLAIKFTCDKVRDYDHGFFVGFKDGTGLIQTPLDLSELSPNRRVVRKMLEKAGAKSYYSLLREKIIKVD